MCLCKNRRFKMNHEPCHCSCTSSTPSVHQTFDELEFSRGIWSAALGGSKNEVLDCINRKGTDPDSMDSSGYTALHYSARNGHIEVCKVLLEHHATPNIQTKSGGVTPLHRAAYCGHTDVVDLLLQFGADFRLADADGKLPIHKAAEKGHTKIVAILKDARPDCVTVRDNRGRVPLDCCDAPSTEMIELLEAPS